VRVQLPADHLRDLPQTIQLQGCLRYPLMMAGPLSQRPPEVHFFRKIGPLGSCAGTTTLHLRRQQYLQRQSRNKEI
jgi:hypothetical protein